jgi:hypothetical protein
MIVAADPDTESYLREVPQNAAADARPDKNVSPIREDVGQPEASPVIAENTVHNDGAADPFENKFVNRYRRYVPMTRILISRSR